MRRLLELALGVLERALGAGDVRMAAARGRPLRRWRGRLCERGAPDVRGTRIERGPLVLALGVVAKAARPSSMWVPRPLGHGAEQTADQRRASHRDRPPEDHSDHAFQPRRTAQARRDATERRQEHERARDENRGEHRQRQHGDEHDRRRGADGKRRGGGQRRLDGRARVAWDNPSSSRACAASASWAIS